ncbi:MULTISPECIES: hypothetical protein [Vibrio]|uniref:DUF6932 family protein n=1 Tax=Vibrio TaxID=662 RepID=UPI0005EF0E59|nr:MULTISPECIES: hypothetical protein [Vibrio]KJQ87517.1 hypothetical protein UG53_07465 [Vibrio sp. S512-13]KJQ91371.1 hypothetical protein UF05_10895 [Vibrio sp. S457-15]MCS0192799.1 hypothetical protein [Vibrio parahaemolyticus]
MIPAFEQSGVLPPFVGDSPTVPANQAPYKVSLAEFVDHFSTSPERIEILIGLLNYRIELKSKGIVSGFQWVDGSFVEDVETIRGRAPNDVDLVTFAERPAGFSEMDWRGFVALNQELFSTQLLKSQYKCDAYYVDLAMQPKLLVSRTAYWFGLFSHQRETSLWKGMLQIDLSCDEEPLLSALIQGGNDAS